MFIKLTMLDTEDFLRINVDAIMVYHSYITPDGKRHSKIYTKVGEYWCVNENPNEIEVKIKQAKEKEGKQAEIISNTLRDIVFTLGRLR